MFEDQALSRIDHIAGERNPVKVADDDVSRHLQTAMYFGGCPFAIEPVPALTGKHDIESSICESGMLDNAFVILNANTCLAVQLCSFRYQLS